MVKSIRTLSNIVARSVGLRTPQKTVNDQKMQGLQFRGFGGLGLKPSPKPRV